MNGASRDGFKPLPGSGCREMVWNYRFFGKLVAEKDNDWELGYFMTTMKKHFLILFASCLGLSAASLSAIASGQQAGRMCAILIGVDEYYRTDDLHFAGRDVSELQKTLEEYCGCRRFHVMDQTQAPSDQPDFAKILWTLDKEIERADQANYDSLLIFFAGHGHRDEVNNQLYLAPGDYIPTKQEQTGISIDFVQQKLNACKSIKHKFLILDTCHSGGSDASKAPLSGREIASRMAQTQNLITLASCRSEEVSREWSDNRHGLFTFWLCVGLSGWADRGSGPHAGNGKIEIGELHAFVAEMVSATLVTLSRRLEKRGQLKTQHIQNPELILGDAKNDVVVADVEMGNPQQKQAAFAKHVNQATRKLRAYQFRAAIRDLEQALAVKPYDPVALAFLAKTYYLKYDDSKEKQDWHTALAHADTSVLLTEYLIRHSPMNSAGQPKKPALAKKLQDQLDAVKERQATIETKGRQR